jgi:hypothetical protein
MLSGERSFANSLYEISCMSAVAFGICEFPARARRHGTCPFTALLAI